MTPSDVSKIIERLDSAIVSIAKLETKLDAHAKHDERISSMERWRAFLTGVVALIFVEMQIVSIYIAARA